MIRENVLLVQKTARYFSLGEANKPSEVWILFHGYGQSAKYFLQKFNGWLPENVLLIAPEGLSKYYLSGVDGRVGASWMTKENREEEIKDQISYIDSLLKVIPIENTKINLLGFSQGAAVACRWYQSSGIKLQNLVIWGAGLPIETTDVMAQRYRECKTIFVLGKSDPYLDNDKLKQYFSTLNGLNFEHETLWYEGAHRIEKEALESLKTMIKS